jgi:hypothetical protein
MSQTIFTKGQGAVEFVRTWANSDGGHIGQLAAGGYAYLSGNPVDKKGDLMSLIPIGSQLDEALEWFKTKDKPKVELVEESVEVEAAPPESGTKTKVQELQDAVKKRTAKK